MKTRLFAGLAALVALMAATPAAAWQPGWSHRMKVTLSPSQTGAAGEIGAQPVLLRLHSGNFASADAKAGGADLRIFAGDDKTPVPFQIERWDAQGQVALVWVMPSDLSAGGATSLYIYYGNDKAAPAGNAKATFATRAVVWQFAEGGAPQDASGHAVTGSANAARDANGLIGQAARLDGGAGVALPSAFQLTAPATVSMWVKPATNAGGGTLFTNGALTIGLEAGIPSVTVGAQRATALAPLASDRWTHIAAVSDGQKTTLYVDGASAGEVAGALPAGAGAASVGQGFAGDVDQFEVARTALPAGALALAANSQGSGAKLATFDKPETVEAGGHGYFGILLGALTPDAWVVIALLAAMSVLSWVVMIQKGITLARVAAANDEFLFAYEKIGRRSEHDGLPIFDFGKRALDSSLGDLYRVGQRELGRRLAEGRQNGSRFAIRAQSIAAIRSALDAAQVREAARLNKWMVLLTIAISGGPFLGLLGTVIGVMITFAAVAAAGDVNINAIAPGIAAALLATVAGLAVAIPALFGYNYLLSRLTDIDTDNQIFVDELEKQIAETWQDVAAPASIAAE